MRYYRRVQVFDLQLSPELLRQVSGHVENKYPEEACGLLLSPLENNVIDEWCAISNDQDRLHSVDPRRFPQSAREAFSMRETELVSAARRAQELGRTERVFVHSHVDRGAYFSPEDRAAAAPNGVELHPKTIHLVLSVRSGKVVDGAAYRFNTETRSFDEHRLISDDLAATIRRTDSLPPIELRAIPAVHANQPIAPVGGRLMSRHVTAEEALRLDRLAEHRVLEVGAADAHMVGLLGRGLLSPLSGFLRAAEVAAVESQGKLLDGTPWRVPLVLDVASAPSFHNGDVICLQHQGSKIGWMGVVEVSGNRLAGPVYVSGAVDMDAIDTRAEILRKQLRTVLALPAHWFETRVLGELDGFDGLLAAEPPAGCDPGRWLPIPPSSGSAWIDAVVAQNAGATHVFIDDPAGAFVVRSTLSIRPWPHRTGSSVRVGI